MFLVIGFCQVLEEGLDFDLIQRKINEPELREGLKNFVVAWKLNGIFGMSRQNILVRSQSFPLNPIGNLLRVTLI